eukprot:TRINITY_DN414_c0_g1_i2.p1 TRINITY_DN414_c0_g1~~TRINITY_DN414_c0_g1_i2.p1  ORF type:complete len:114 (-),score=21.17 TRINITY_DN414_c0_g1_i2:161-502(-)
MNIGRRVVSSAFSRIPTMGPRRINLNMIQKRNMSDLHGKELEDAISKWEKVTYWGLIPIGILLVWNVGPWADHHPHQDWIEYDHLNSSPPRWSNDPTYMFGDHHRHYHADGHH